MKIIDKINASQKEGRTFFSFEFFPPREPAGMGVRLVCCGWCAVLWLCRWHTASGQKEATSVVQPCSSSSSQRCAGGVVSCTAPQQALVNASQHP